ncbi:MAG TPA: hypothetical protein VFD84_02990 [Candidatus Binatia bacterium]|jgi:hypothetical protein|nr:hypothetical protein [Candidatus Binatia bacterium]
MAGTTWQELVIAGSKDAARAFVEGFLAGAQAGGFFGADVGLEPASLGERLRELLGEGSHHAFFAPAEVVASLADAIDVHGEALGLRAEHPRDVRGAHFAFRAEAFARDAAARIRDALFVALPAGVRVEDVSEAEETHPDARAADVYAPVHAYAYRTSGRIAGALPGVVDVRGRATGCDLIHVGALHVDVDRPPH